MDKVEKNVQISLWLTYQDNRDMTIEEYTELMRLMGTDDESNGIN